MQDISMKNNRQHFYLVLLVFLLVAFCTAGESTNKSGTTAAQFLKIGVGARAMGMAGAFVSSVDDAYSLYWNPAALPKVQNPSLVAVFTDWFTDIRHQFLGFVLPINEASSVGVQATVLNMGTMEITTIGMPHGTGEFFNARDLSIGLSYGIRLTNFFSVGITGKYIEQEIYNESASTFAIDIGSVLDVPVRGMKLGMRLANFGGKLQLDGRDLTREYDMNPENTLNVGVETRLKTLPWELPVLFQVGLSSEIIGSGEAFLTSENNRLILAADGTHPMDAPEFAAFGLEYTFNDLISLRTGYRLNRDVEKFYYGLGIKVPFTGSSNFTFDYALASFEELDYIHIFSGGIAF